MVYTQSQSNTDIWRIRIPDRNVKTNTAEPSRVPFIYSTQLEYMPEYSPDGQRVAFVSRISGVGEIWVCDGDGANPVQVTTGGWPVTISPRWSPDTDDLGNDWGPSWSRDGRWIYFVSNRSGREEVWKAPAAGGTFVQATTNGGSGPLESPDGRYVYYFKSGRGLWRIPADGGDERQVLESLSGWRDLTLTEQGVYFVHSSETPNESSIEFLSISNEKIHTVARLEKPPFHLTVSPNGRELLYAQSAQRGTDLMLVENFR